MAKATAKPAAKTTALAKQKTAVALPADLAARREADVAALKSKLAAPTGKSILVTQSKNFKFPDDTKCDTFKGVIVGFVSANAYYENDYDPDNIVPPNCFAIGVVKNDDLVASPNSPDAQNADDENVCASCWANQWKSAAKGNGKACKNSIKLAILCEDGEIRPLSLSSTALKPFGEYVREVVNTFGVAPYYVLTTFSFDPKFDYSSVRCSDPLLLDDKQLAVVLSRKDDADAMLLVEPDVSEFEEKVVAKRNAPKGRGGAAAAKGGKALPAAKGRSARA